MKIVILYEELAEYVLASIAALRNKYGAEIHLFRKSVNRYAPFVFNDMDYLHIRNRDEYKDNALITAISEINPDLLFCGGWMYKPYLKVSKKYKSKIPVILGFDNKWQASIKQQMAAALNKITIQKYFSHCWIPGSPQVEFAKRLGFNDKNIFIGFYSCDYEKFNSLYLKHKEYKKKNYPHRLIFVGRYYKFKGISELWNSFISIQNENPNNWELWCLGTGNIHPIVHPKIKHFGFVQPNDMENIIRDCGVFVLPSTFEPWGVAVHEFASAGFPLICSSEVGAATQFLKDEENGFLFKAGNITQLKNAMRKIISLSDEQLVAMGERSVELAKQITPAIWADTLMSILKTEARR